MIRFIKLKEQHLKQVLEWRTQENVTRFMNTDIEKNYKKQLEWFKSISDSRSDKYWLIEIKGQLVGLIYLTTIDTVNKRTSWGYYIGEENYRLYGGLIPPYLYNYVFLELGLQKVTAEVFCENTNVIQLNKMHGCREVGVYKEHIYKRGQFHDVMLMELLKEDWLKLNKFKKYISEFEE